MKLLDRPLIEKLAQNNGWEFCLKSDREAVMLASAGHRANNRSP